VEYRRAFMLKCSAGEWNEFQSRKFASIAVQPLRISGVEQQQQQQQVANVVKVIEAKN
jgi:hypothetical protein